MRVAGLFLLFLLPGPFAGALPDDGGSVVRSEKYNFEIHTPADSVDWTIEEISEASAKAGMRAHLRTVFADSNPVAEANVYVSVTPLSADFVRRSLDKISKKWAPFMEEHLEHPRDRTEQAGKFGEVDYYRVDVKGDHEAGIHRRTWYLAKNGKFIYLIYIDRSYRAVNDEFLEEELQTIMKSFRFLRVEKVEKNKQGPKKGGMPNVGGPASKSNAKKIDPELLEKETFKEPFWRFSCLKPQGLLKRTLTDIDKKRDTKFWFANDKDGSRLWLRIYAQTVRAKKFTLEQLLEHKLGYWKKEVKVSKEPKIDKNYKFPMAKKAIRIDLVGRSTNTIRRVYILMNCKNDRQYQLEIFMSGTNGLQVWGKTVKKFIKNFKPTKK